MAALLSRQRINLALALFAGVVLIAASLMGMWLTAAAMVLMIVGQLGTLYAGRRTRRS